jgi:hypothetical protein
VSRYIEVKIKKEERKKEKKIERIKSTFCPHWQSSGQLAEICLS